MERTAAGDRSPEVLELLRTRRSIRKFEPRKLPAKILQMLQEAVLRAPSSRNLQPWTFLFVNEPAILARLARARQDGASRFVSGAPLAVAVCGDEAVSDVWIEDCAIAAFILHLTAHSLGLGSCWVQIRNRRHSAAQPAEDYVRELLNIPDRLRVLALVAIGFPAETKPPRPQPDLKSGKIFFNRFGQKREHLDPARSE